MAILSGVRRSTSGRAPWFSAIIRFWIKVESLNRPPTLFTISSSFNSSSIRGSSSTAKAGQKGHQVADGPVEVVVHHEHGMVTVGLFDFPSRLAQAPLDHGFIVAGP